MTSSRVKKWRATSSMKPRHAKRGASSISTAGTVPSLPVSWRSVAMTAMTPP